MISRMCAVLGTAILLSVFLFDLGCFAMYSMGVVSFDFHFVLKANVLGFLSALVMMVCAVFCSVIED